MSCSTSPSTLEQIRDDYRRLMRPLGVEPETINLATPREVVLARIRERAAPHADDFPLTEDLAAAYFDRFDVPTPDEGPLAVVPYAGQPTHDACQLNTLDGRRQSRAPSDAE
jgi:hypothetical protein